MTTQEDRHGGRERRLAPWLLLALLGGLTGLLAWGNVRARALPPQAVARINGNLITYDNFNTELRLRAMRAEMLQRPLALDRPRIFNQMLQDELLLEGAQAAGISISSEELAAEIGRILARLQVNEAGMAQALGRYELGWADFETSVRDYLALTHYANDIILAELPASQRQSALSQWLDAQYQAADMVFDDGFLEAINPPAAAGDQT